MRRVNGRAIEDYKRFEVRETGLAVPEAEPLYKEAISNGYAPHDFIVDSSLVLYLPLYLLKGSTFKSVDRYAHSCTVTGASWKPNGRYFDGSDDRIDCPDISGIEGATELTIAVWVKATTAGGWTAAHVVVGKGDILALGGGWNEHLPTFYMVDSSPAWKAKHGAITVDDGAFHLIVATLGNSLLTLYIDGVQDSATASAGTGTINSPENEVVEIGCLNNNGIPGDYLSGTVSEVWIFNRAFTLSEVQNIYLATKWRHI